MMMILWISLLIISCIWIAKACDLFEPASDYLGRGLGPGIKGATINAIGSSLPELFTAFIFLFWFNDKAGFSSGVATTAGSAVFNAVIIPGLVILSTLTALKIKGIELDKKVIVRDGIFFIFAELALIYFLSQEMLTWTMGLSLMVIYAVYAGYLIMQQRKHAPGDNEHVDYEFDSNTKAWKALLWSVLQIGIACFILTESVVQLAGLWNINTFFVAVIIAAAATSVPDTIISIKDAKKGNYEDAVSNAVGSNIFDICIGLGLPLFIYTLVNGSFNLNLGTEVGVAELRVLLIIVSVMVLALFLIPKKLGYGVAICLLSMYLFYASYTIGRGLDVEWVKPIATMLNSIL